MILQKINYWGDGLGKVVCAVNVMCKGGEFTMCGNNCVNAGKAEEDDWDIIDNEFTGTLKQVTCPNCLNFIHFIKNLK